jgi:hypothetical protein
VADGIEVQPCPGDIVEIEVGDVERLALVVRPAIRSLFT